MKRFRQRKRLGQAWDWKRSVALSIFAALPAWAYASPATEWGLFNSGVDTAQKVLAENGADPHYTLIEPSPITGAPLVHTALGGFPVPPWADDNSFSAWISPTADTNAAPETFVYRTTFNLPANVVNGLSINGKWSVDNTGVDILLNGNSLGLTNNAGFGGFTPFTLDSGFITGANTLDFLVNNAPPGDNPMGFRVEFEGNGFKAPPPPPHANAIKTLYPTGVGNDFGALDGDIVDDPHYQLVASPAGGTVTAVTVPDDGFPVGGAWIGNDSNSRWISPPPVDGGNDAMGDPGTYVYQTKFNMTGLDPNNAVIVAARATDDGGDTVLLNGVEVPNAVSRGFGGKTWIAINAASAKAAGTSILPGENTLAFTVENGGDAANPTGLRIDDLFARAAPSGSSPIPGLFNTGVNNNGLPLDDFESDPHYRVDSGPDGEAYPSVVLPNDGFPIPPWLDNTSTSRWIVPTEDPDGTAPAGDYDVSIDFDLTGLDPDTAVIQGLWSADNTGTDILLNGVATGNPQGGSFPTLSQFEISKALGDVFKPGKNTLTFHVNNAGDAPNPVGLRVEGLMAYAFAKGNLVGDFNANGTLDAADIDLLSQAVRNGSVDTKFDLTGDGKINQDDRLNWVNVRRKTYMGDSNLDGEFSSSDFVFVFQAGEYEDGVAGNSEWATGDWDGNGDFESGDFVAAFQEGGYEVGPRAGVSAVPEPSSLVLLLLSSLPLLRLRRNR